MDWDLLKKFNKTHSFEMSLFHNNIPIRTNNLEYEVFVSHPSQAGLFQWYMRIDNEHIVPVTIWAYQVPQTIFTVTGSVLELTLDCSVYRKAYKN